MSEISILLVDEDERYLTPLERRFIEGFEVSVDIHVITDRTFLEQFFQQPQSFDIMIINQDLYYEDMARHNISNVFLLVEEEEEENDDIRSSHIYKYTSDNDIYKRVIHNISDAKMKIKKNEDAKCIYISSPIGGSGTTTIAAGICSVLAQSHQRVLYIGMSSLQDFGWIMKEFTELPSDVERQILTQSDFVYHLVKQHIVKEQFYILPPFGRPLAALGITVANYCKFLKSIKSSKEYDYIIIDGSGDFYMDTPKLMRFCERVVVVALQDKISMHKISCFLRNIDCSNQNHFTFVCNKFRSTEENKLVANMHNTMLQIAEYIEYQNNVDMSDIQCISNIRDIQKIAINYM